MGSHAVARARATTHAGSHQHYLDVNPKELADAHRDAGVLVFQHHSRTGWMGLLRSKIWGKLTAPRWA